MNWYQRFLASTRGRILMLLRRESSTVDDLAQTLDLTDNAVRAHLAGLERDGLVRQHGERRSSSKPAYVYELAPEAEKLFPKSYEQVLNELLQVMNEQMSKGALKEMLQVVGRRIAAQWTAPEGDVRLRAQAAVDVLNELGGMAELKEEDGRLTIHSFSCPLNVIVPEHPEACSLAETLVAELVGVPVHEQCDKGKHPRCRFAIQADASP